MAKTVWTAAELENLSPAEQDEIFAASVVTELESVPEEYLAKVRSRVRERIEATDAAPQA